MNQKDVEILTHFFAGEYEQVSSALATICKALSVCEDAVSNIEILSQGMTNHSFLFSCCDRGKYIMRVPGEGTARLISRKQEAAVYQAIAGKGICDEIIYIDPESGYKLTKFFEGARMCNPLSLEDVRRCMVWLKRFHDMGVIVKHEFDIFEQIDFYESLWNGVLSVHKDYAEVKRRIFSLQAYIDNNTKRKVLTHMDAVPDNFLFVQNKNGDEEIRLLDWEYAGMQNPLVDIAMFCIYSFYDKAQIDRTISAYFPEGCTWQERVLIYCYIAACGLLWSNWCEYKKILGVDFGEYSLKQYCYANKFFEIVQGELGKNGKGMKCTQ